MNSETKNEIYKEKENKNNNIENEVYYVIDYKNKLEINKNIINNLDKIDKTFTSEINISYTNDSINQANFIINKNNEANIYLNNNIEKFVSIFIEKLFPSNNLNEFNICKKLSFEYFKISGGKIDKDKIEKCINFIFSNKQNITYNKKVTINLKFIKNFGYIIMAS